MFSFHIPHCFSTHLPKGHNSRKCPFVPDPSLLCPLISGCFPPLSLKIGKPTIFQHYPRFFPRSPTPMLRNLCLQQLLASMTASFSQSPLLMVPGISTLYALIHSLNKCLISSRHTLSSGGNAASKVVRVC